MEGFISELKEDEIDRSVVVRGLNLSMADKNDLEIYFQMRKYGGGDVDKLEIFDNATAAIVVFGDKKCAERVLDREQVIRGTKVNVENCRSMANRKIEVFCKVLAKLNPVVIDLSNQDTNDLVKQFTQESGVQRMEDNRDGGFVVTGSYRQIVAFHDSLHSLCLAKRKSKVNPTANVATMQEKNKGGDNLTEELTPKGVTLGGQPLSKNIDEERNEDHSKKFECRGYGELESSKEKPIKKIGKWLTKSGDEENQEKRSLTDPKEAQRKNDAQTDTSPCEFKIKVREWNVFAKTNKEDLRQLISDYGVVLQLRDTTCKVVKSTSKECEEQKLKAVTDKLVQMYSKAVQYMKCERFTLADGEKGQQNKLRQLVLDINKKESIVLERAPDRQSWEIFGVSRKVDDILSLLEAKVGIRRLKTSDSDDEDADKEHGISDGQLSCKESKKYEPQQEDVDDDVDPNKRLQHQIGNLKVSVYKGDITEENSDAIVNAANQRLCHERPVARAIVTKGGSSIQDECARIIATKGELKTGDAVVTHSGKLNCKMVIHAVVPIWDPKNQEQCILQLKMACISSLQQADKYRFGSISFAAVISDMPKKLCAEAMFDVVEECSKLPNALKVRDIRFVNNDEKTIKAFQKVLRKRYGDGEIVTLNENKERRPLTKVDSSQIPQLLQHQKLQSSTKSQPRFPGTKPQSSSVMSSDVSSKCQQGDTTSSNEVNQPGKRHNSSTGLKASNFAKLMSGKEIKLFEPSALEKDWLAFSAFASNSPSGWTADRKTKMSYPSETDQDSSIVFTSYGVDSSRTGKDAFSKRQYLTNASKANGWDQWKTGSDSKHFQNGRDGNEQHPTINGCVKWNSPKDIMKVQSNPTSNKPQAKRIYEDYGQMQVPITSRGVVVTAYSGARPKQSCKHPYEEDQTCRDRHEEDQDRQCPICHGILQCPKTLPQCKHTFCRSCLERALKTAKWCPLCRSPLQGNTGIPKIHPQQTDSTLGRVSPHNRQRQFTGSSQATMHSTLLQVNSQPHGTMTSRKEHFSLPGYEEYGTILIQYSFRDGIQGPEHPNPDQRYDGTSRSAYLPDNKQGATVLKLLKIAFDRGLVFKIGRSMTSGYDNQIVWADIPHKTSIDGGPSNYGYPDPVYLTEVQQILQAMLI